MHSYSDSIHCCHSSCEVAYCQKNKVESWKVKLAYMDDNFVRFKLGKKNQNQEGSGLQSLALQRASVLEIRRNFRYPETC